MSDLVERLRSHVVKRGGAAMKNGAWSMMTDAANRIEALEAALRGTLAVAERNETGGFAVRARAALVEETAPDTPNAMTRAAMEEGRLLMKERRHGTYTMPDGSKWDSAPTLTP